MRLARRQFILLAGLAAADMLLETQGCGAVSILISSVKQFWQNGLIPLPASICEKIKEPLYAFFDPSLRPYLRSITIVTSTRAQTGYTLTKTSNHESLIVLNPDFFCAARESIHWTDCYSKPPYNMKPEQPVFDDNFLLQVIAHEMFHVIQAHINTDTEGFSREVELWYRDESSGRPTPGGNDAVGTIRSNYTKLVLWWNLYGQPGSPQIETDSEWKKTEYCMRYRHAQQGLEEFAYVGETFLVPTDTASRRNRLSDISDQMYRYYAGVIAPSILELRPERPY
jgi:hypothetical protein